MSKNIHVILLIWSFVGINKSMKRRKQLQGSWFLYGNRTSPPIARLDMTPHGATSGQVGVWILFLFLKLKNNNNKKENITKLGLHHTMTIRLQFLCARLLLVRLYINYIEWNFFGDKLYRMELTVVVSNFVINILNCLTGDIYVPCF